MPEFMIPALAEHIETATITQWLRGSGDIVAFGEELVEVETDKAISVLQADAEGTLTILVQAGETVPVMTPIATIGLDTPHGAVTAGPGQGGRQVVSPVARRLAAAAQLDLRTIRGTGPGGRVVKRDIVAAASAGRSSLNAADDAPDADNTSGRQVAPGAVPDAVFSETTQPRRLVPVSTAVRSSTIEPLTRRRQLVAARMQESNATIPDFCVETDVDMTGCRQFRQQLSALDRAPVPSYNDMVIKASALALRAFPKANSSVLDEASVSLHADVNVAFAVASGEDLFAPTVFGAAELSLGEIARSTRELIGKVKDGTIAPHELSGATFTVSNLGMFGVTRFTAVVTPPQAAILAVGAIRPAPVVRDGRLAVGLLMTLSLSSDHRILYGADAAQVVQHIRATLEQPAALLL
jgi:pyruvate dehydrogenase E2 component (dihydrolipoamide acetyltransferase)